MAAGEVDAEPASWDDPAVDWAAYDLVVIRSTWDYLLRREEFVAWTRRVPRLLNPASVVGWNTDKIYLAELAGAGLPTVPTVFVRPGDPVDVPAAGEFVVKPAVSAGALDTARYADDGAAAAESHVARLHEAGRTAMIQPYVSAVDTHGETALLYIGGAYSHCVRKGPLLAPRGAAEVEGLFREESISARVPEPAERALAERVLQAVPGGSDRLLYARVDVLPGPDGSPLLLELELTEPSLFLSHAPGAADRFATAIKAAAQHAVRQAAS